jgi:hypothetical protein
MKRLFSLCLLLLAFAAVSANPRALAWHAASAQTSAQAPAQAGAQASAQAPAMASAGMADRKPVVVELFTSEGCSSCPPADNLLRALETKQPIAGAEIIALEEHVDYWNQDGWEDPYSSAEWTSRQKEYVAKFKGDGAYTPQMVVDGEKEFTGNNIRSAKETIVAAAQQQLATITITPDPEAKGDEQHFQVRVGNVPPGGEKADVWLAITEDGLGNNVEAGENKGKNLQHAAVVRSLLKIGSTGSKGAADFSADPQVKFKSSWKKENLRVVVFVQDKKNWHILGAAYAKVAG